MNNNIDTVFFDVGATLRYVVEDPEFAAAFQRAREQGVEVWHFACRVAADRIEVASVFRECLHKAESP